MSDIKFRPVRGTEKKILNSQPYDGNLYFATDTGQIFLAENGKFIPMGGSGVSILYAQDPVINNNNGTYTLQQKNILDKTAIPKADDLIINKDGRFFKVIYYNTLTGTISCQLIAVSGSGGGGSSGDPAKDISVTYHTESWSFLKGDKLYLDLTAIAPKGISTMSFKCEIYVPDRHDPKKTISTQITSGQRVNFEIGEAMELGNNRIEISITAPGANKFSETIDTIRMVSMNVETDLTEFSNYKVFDTTFIYYIKYYTSVSANLKVLIDGNVVSTTRVGETSENGALASVTVNPQSLKLDTGTHIISAYLEEDGGFKSNETEIDFIYHPATEEKDAVYIVLTSYPNSILSYEIPEVKYWVYDTSKKDGDINNITLLVNGAIAEQISKVQLPGSVNGLSWLITGLEANVINTCSIRVEDQDRSIERSFEIYVEKSDIFDPVQSSAVLLLSSEGRTNDTSLEKRTKWEYTNYNGKTVSAKFNNFNWENNGWKTDEEGKVCLRISNGANIEIPIRLFQDYSSAGTSGYTIEFEFKPYNLYSYQSLSQVSETIEDEEGDVIDVIRDYDMTKASITYALSSGKESSGLGIGTQDIFFRMYETNDAVAAQYIENKIINVSLVINTNNRQMLIYLNGILSGMTGYTNPENAIPYGINNIKINSDFADIDLYSVRMYNRALASTEIVQNYMASKKDLKLYQQNQLGAVDNTVSFADLVKYNKENPENCTIPYIVFKTKSEPNILPFNKENDDVVVDITFTNVAADYKLKMSAKTDSDIREYLKHAPSFFAADVNLNVQGTSSQKYPRKNFKGKMLKKSTSTLVCSNELVPEEQRSMSRLYLNPDAGEKTFTWKADYMDSSGKHNTGFTSFVKEVYNKHPLDYYFGTDGEYYDKYRTTIFGFPVLAFHENSKGEIQFIGRYNFNLDKSCEKSLGMTLEDKHPILSDKTIEEVAECWEFGNNQSEGRCAFRYENDFFENIWNLIEDLEPRYHIDGDTIEAAFKLQDEDKNSIPEETAIQIIKDKYQHLAKVMEWVKANYCGFDLNNNSDQVLAKIGMGLAANKEEANSLPNIKESDEEFILFKAERMKKFQEEFKLHFNEEYCAVYFVMTEVLLLFDSRGKNMMLGSWGPLEKDGEYIWFPMFYDVDTQLGINNSGYPTMEYNLEPTKENQFSTPVSLFWRSYNEVFGKAIRNKYREIRNSGLKIANINAYYDFDESKSIAMKGILPISIINADAFYKYILPSYATSKGGGYVSDIGTDGKPIYSTSAKYFYCIQGTRDLYREQFLRNRFNYYDSYWIAGQYSGGLAGDKLRVRALTTDSEDDSLDSNFIINITPVLDQYISAFTDETEAETLYERRVKTSAGEAASIDLNNIIGEGASDQIVSIPGAAFIQKLGDLSLLYLGEIELPANINEIYLGNENPKYVANKNINLVFTQIHGQDGMTEYPLLKEYDITNLPLTKHVTLDGSPKLEIFKALGSFISGVSFADSVDLKRLYLPNTITSLVLNKASNLNKIIFNLNETNEDGLYIKDFIHQDENNNNLIKLNNIDITGNGLHQYSYEFLEKAVQTKEEMQKVAISSAYTPYLGIQLKDVLWSPYKVLGEGAIYDTENAKKYKYANNNFTFSDYEYITEEKWNLHIANGRIYEYIGSDVAPAKDLSLLDKLIENIYFVSKHHSGVSTGDPYISGELYIDNDASNPIPETVITNYYNKHFPDLKIRVANVAASNRVRFIQKHEPTMGQTEKEISVLRFDPDEYKDGDFAKALVLPQVPKITHYDGYSDIWIYEDAELTKEEIINLVNDFKDETEYTFYTKYERHPYKITFHYDDSKDAYEKEVLYNDIIGTPSEIYPYKDDSNLSLTECYSFQYYVGEENSSIKIDLDNLKATQDMKVWAYFKEDSVYNNILKTNEYIKWNGYDKSYTLSIDKNIKTTALKGKITLPLLDGVHVSLGASLLQGNNLITHIFFENTKKPLSVSFNTSVFRGMNQLEYVELPKGISDIGTSVFNGTPVKYIGPAIIKNEDYEQLDSPTIKLPNTITSIEKLAFNTNRPSNIILGEENAKWNLENINKISSEASNGTSHKSGIIYTLSPISAEQESLLSGAFNTVFSNKV